MVDEQSQIFSWFSPPQWEELRPQGSHHYWLMCEYLRIYDMRAGSLYMEEFVLLHIRWYQDRCLHREHKETKNDNLVGGAVREQQQNKQKGDFKSAFTQN